MHSAKDNCIALIICLARNKQQQQQQASKQASKQAITTTPTSVTMSCNSVRPAITLQLDMPLRIDTTRVPSFLSQAPRRSIEDIIGDALDLTAGDLDDSDDEQESFTESFYATRFYSGSNSNNSDDDDDNSSSSGNNSNSSESRR
jgi:hypothetical protein